MPLVAKFDGTLYTEVYSSKVLNTVTCPSSYIWRDILKGVNKQILTELKTNGVYMDQIGCANSEPCYATNHGHAPGGGDWWPLPTAVYSPKCAQIYTKRTKP